MNLVGTLTIETERLLLRSFTLDDSEDMYNNWAKHEECFEYLPWKSRKSKLEVEEQIKRWIELYKDSSYFQWVIELKKSKKIIGTINLHNVDIDNFSAETTYILSPKFWNKGIMTEAFGEVLKFGFEKVELNRISADFYSGNDTSQKVMLKNNLRYEGTSREKYYKDGKYYDSIQYAILKNDWEQGKIEPEKTEEQSILW